MLLLLRDLRPVVRPVVVNVDDRVVDELFVVELVVVIAAANSEGVDFK